MRAAVYRNNLGAAQLYLEPSQAGSGDSVATLPSGPFDRASAQMAARGGDVDWEDWADQLAGQYPYFDRWTAEDVPDGLTAQQALSHVRERDAESMTS